MKGERGGRDFCGFLLCFHIQQSFAGLLPTFLNRGEPALSFDEFVDLAIECGYLSAEPSISDLEPASRQVMERDLIFELVPGLRPAFLRLSLLPNRESEKCPAHNAYRQHDDPGQG